MGVGVTRRGVANIPAILSVMLTTTTRLVIQNAMRVRRSVERRTIPPEVDWLDEMHYSTLARRHKHGDLGSMARLLTVLFFCCILTMSHLMTAG
jgi:hypothetical protein